MNNEEKMIIFVTSLIALVIALIFEFRVLLGWSIGVITILSVLYLGKKSNLDVV